MRRFMLRMLPCRRLATSVLLLALIASPAFALLDIDFEQPYYVHPGMQVWDFCLVQDGETYHIFYHAIPMDNPTPAYADHVWRSTSSDLIHWSAPQVVLSVSAEPWESNAVWAPDVVRDPDSGRWWMAYTAVDQLNNQRVAMAWSDDLLTWTKVPENPVFEPDPVDFYYDPAGGGAECRDPYLYLEDGVWNLLVSAKLRGWTGGRGAVVRSQSTDLVTWSPGEAFLANDGDEPYNSLESSQYLPQADGSHHVFFHEYAGAGISHIGAFAPADWTFADRVQIDLGIAPEVDTFDGGENYVFSRVAPYQEPQETAFSYVARLDTLDVRPGEAPPQVVRFQPLARHFADYAGNICLGNPTFGDNPGRRGEPTVGLDGNFYFGSREYFQGPLSGRGDAGREIGLTATGWLNSYPFVIEGNTITMKLGGTDNPEACFVALMDAAADTVLRRATGHGNGTMTNYTWDVTELQGREVYVRIEDSDPYGHINVDSIRETFDSVTAAAGPAVPAVALRDLGPSPNPFNPATRLRFELAAAATVEARVHDLRGRLVWSSAPQAWPAGPGAVTWTGIGRDGSAVPAGVYVYRLLSDGREAASGKMLLVP